MNWTQLIKDLRERGETYESIGREVGYTGAAIRALANNEGQDMHYKAGSALKLLHAKVMRKYPRIDTHA